MTGFGEARARFGQTTLVCRIRSLNHRFLDLKMRLPRGDMLSVDMAIRKRVSDVIKRGAVEFTITSETARDSSETLINSKAALAYWSAVSDLKTMLPGVAKSDSLSLDALLRLPGVVGSASSDDSLTHITDDEILSKLVEPALAALKQSRAEEGTKLCTHLETLIAQMDAHVDEIKTLEAPEKEKARQVIIERATETLKLLKSIGNTQSTSEFASRLQEEAVFWIEKRDFEEERMRLQMHLKSFRELLTGEDQADGSVSGKKLEFLQQEILREINTLGTKAHSPAITEHTIELKTILERIREQLANVE